MKALNRPSLRMIALLCALCVLSLLPIGPSAKADIAEGKTGSLTWRLTDKGKLIISGTGETGNFSRNDESSAWKPYNKKIRSVVVKKGVTRIGWWAFANCPRLRSVSLPDTVTKIDVKAFYNCPALTTLTIPGSVKEIGEQAFADCTALTALAIPAGVEKFGKKVFANCGGSSDVNDNLFSTRAEFEKYCGETGVVLQVESGSAAERYARDNNLSFQVGSAFFPGLKKRVLDKADAIVAECVKPGMSEKQIARALHDWIVYHSYYGRCDNYEDFLLSGCGFCTDYAGAYRLLLSKAGLANGLAWGETRTDSHAWNWVRIDGTWCHIDTTFDDPGTKAVPRSGNERTRFFMLTDAQIKKDRTWGNEDWLKDSTSSSVYDPAR